MLLAVMRHHFKVQHFSGLIWDESFGIMYGGKKCSIDSVEQYVEGRCQDTKNRHHLRYNYNSPKCIHGSGILFSVAPTSPRNLLLIKVAEHLEVSHSGNISPQTSWQHTVICSGDRKLSSIMPLELQIFQTSYHQRELQIFQTSYQLIKFQQIDHIEFIQKVAVFGLLFQKINRCDQVCILALLLKSPHLISDPTGFALFFCLSPSRSDVANHRSILSDWLSSTRHSQTPKWKEFLHKLLVGGLGYAPVVCWKILRN